MHWSRKHEICISLRGCLYVKDGSDIKSKDLRSVYDDLARNSCSQSDCEGHPRSWVSVSPGLDYPNVGV